MINHGHVSTTELSTMQYTSEQLNYFRICYIAFNLVPEGLRTIFKQEWDFRYKATLGEWKDAPQNGRDFFNNESRKSRTKNARYLATIQNGNMAEWDCSCLFFAILFSDSIGTTLSAAISKDVDDLRQVRNDIAHISEAELTDAELKNYVGRVLVAFNALKLAVTDIVEIKNQTTFPIEEVAKLKMQVNNLQNELKKAKSDVQVARSKIKIKEEQVKTLKSDLQVAQDKIQSKEEQVECLTQQISSKVESFCNLTFKPSHEIIRRSNDVTRIMSKMKEFQDGSNGAVSTIYLLGNPGCGKTQIARQIGEEFFLKRSRATECLTFVATLNAETLETLADSYFTLAKQLGITEYTLTNLATLKANSAKEAIQHLKVLISPKIKQFSEWLIIADNVANLSLVRSYLPQTASEEWGHGQVLITTQDSSEIPANAPHTYHESLSGGMQPGDAVELLKQVSQISNHEQAETVAEILEYQPLALAAAAFYVQTVVSYGSPNYFWASYLETFGSGEREATEEPLAKENAAYPKSMTTAIKMAINSASKSDEVLQQAFCLLSMCACESLPIEIAVNFVKARKTKQPEELIKAKILKSSLITSLCNEEGAPEYLRVHNIVHEVLKAVSSTCEFELPESISETIKIVHLVTLTERNYLFQNGNSCVKLRRVTSHCKVLHEILTKRFASRDLMVKNLAPHITPDNVASWLSTTADICCELISPSDAKLFSTSACELIEYISSSREGGLLKSDVLAVHGRVLSLQCDYESSLLFFKWASAISISINGKEHASVAGSYNNLGNVLRKLGEYNEAKEYYQKALVITNKNYGLAHAEVVTSYNNLGVVFSDLRQHSKAKEYHEKALVIERKIYGEEHADVARSYNNLGNVHSDLGHYNQAKDYHEKALMIRMKIYGEEHADIAGSYNNLGNVFRNLGMYVQAKECHEKALKIRRKIYGDEHAKVAASYHNLRLLHCDLRQCNHAKTKICTIL